MIMQFQRYYDNKLKEKEIKHIRYKEEMVSGEIYDISKLFKKRINNWNLCT